MIMLKCIFKFCLGLIFNLSINIDNKKNRVYRIPSGEHLSRPFFNPSKVNGNELNFRFWLSDSCNSYTSNNPEQVNKLLGLSTRPFIKSDKSAILGWSTDKNGKMSLWLFVNYNNGKPREFKQIFIGYADTEKWYDVKLWEKNSEYFLKFNNNVVSLPKKDDYNLYWLVEPYFGGKESNPNINDCIIKIELL